MPVKRLPSPESALAELTAQLAERGCMPIDEAHDFLRDHLEGEDAQGVLERALDSPHWSRLLVDAAGTLLHVPSLTRGRVFTHRLTEAEATADEIDLTWDAPPVVRVLADDCTLVLGGQFAYAEVGLPERLVLPASCRTLALPEGLCRSLGWHAGTLLSLQVADAPRRATTRPEVAGHAAQDHPGPMKVPAYLIVDVAPDASHDRDEPHEPNEPKDPHEPDMPGFAEAFSSDHDAFMGVATVDEFILRVLHRHPDLLRAPAPPISETLASMGLTDPDMLIAHLTDTQRAHVREVRISELATKHQLSDAAAETLLDAIDWLGRWQAEGAARLNNGHTPTTGCDRARSSDLGPCPGAHPAARIDAAMRDPTWAEALADEAIVHPEMSLALAEFAERPTRGLPKAPRIGRLYLAGRAAEAFGQPLAAAAHYREADRLGDAPHALRQLARIERDRGDFTAAAALLGRAGADVNRELLAAQVHYALSQMSSAAPERKPSRNQPCWCDSGRKYKRCHGRSGPAGPLSERAWWLYVRVGWYMSDAVPGVLPRLLASPARTNQRTGRPDLIDAIGLAGVPDPAVAPEGPVTSHPADVAKPSGTSGPASLTHIAGLPNAEAMGFALDVLAAEGEMMTWFRYLRGEVLPSDEAALLDSWLATPRGLYEVVATDPRHVRGSRPANESDHGPYLRLQHVATGDVSCVVASGATIDLRRGDLVCARLLDMGGELVPCGAVRVPPTRRDDWLDALGSTSGVRPLLEVWGSGSVEPPEHDGEGYVRIACVGVLTADDPKSLTRELNELYGADEPDHWEFSERITLASGLTTWTEAVQLDLVGKALTVVAWSRERYEMTIRQLATLPTPLTEHVFYTSDPHTFVHPIWGTYEDEDEDSYDRWLEDLANDDLHQEGDGDDGWTAADAS